MTEYRVEHEGAGSETVSATATSSGATITYLFTRMAGASGISYGSNRVTWDNQDYADQAKLEVKVRMEGQTNTYTVWLDNVRS